MLEILEAYKTHLQQKNYKPRGIEEQERDIKKYLLYSEEHDIDIFSINIKEAESYREHLRLLADKKGNTRYNPTSVNRHISFLRVFYRYLVFEQKAFRNPFENLEKVKERKSFPKNILNIEETEKLFDSIEVKTKYDFKFKVVCELLYSTGARINEIETMLRDDIDLEKGYIKVRDDKERQDRKIILTEYSIHLLKLYMKYFKENGNQLFKHGAKRNLNNWINLKLRQLCKKLKLPPVSCHGFRHTIATHLLKSGADIREVQEFLGHRKVLSTEIYTHIFPEDLKEVVEKSHPREMRYTNETE